MTTSPAAEVQSLYRSPIGLYPFQAEGVAYCYERNANLLVWDCGIGKTHAAMATAALLFEDGLIDLCLVVCEKNKLSEWEADFAVYTGLDAKVYKGEPARRRKLVTAGHQVLIATYETLRNDAGRLLEVKGLKKPRLVPGFFTEHFAGQRVLVVYDEMTKLGNRGSGNHKAHAILVEHLQDHGVGRVMGLTATPVENSPENLYNLGRILCPAQVGGVAQFERDHVAGRHPLYKHQVTKWKNLDQLADKLSGVILRKRKTDADVIEQFPARVEEFTYVDLDSRHKDFYDTVDEIFEGCTPAEEGMVFTALRQIAGHPASLVRSQGKIAEVIVGQVGADALHEISSAKVPRLLEYLEPLVKGQGAQVVVFTFFGQSVLPVLQVALEAAGYLVSVNHGQMSQSARERSQLAFRSGETQIFLSSDAGQRGINLPEASYVVNYELPLTYAAYQQRIDRIHRIDSKHPSVTAMTFIARGTVETEIAGLVLKKNTWSDRLIDGDVTDEDDGDFITAAQRREIMKAARGR